MRSAHWRTCNISTFVRFWHSDKMCSIHWRCCTVNLRICVNRLWIVDLEIWTSLFMFLVEENDCLARTAVMASLILLCASICSLARRGSSLARNYASRRYTIIVEYAMISEPGVSIIFLCIVTADMYISRRYSTIDHWSMWEVTS
jgi:hypothetical protein